MARKLSKQQRQARRAEVRTRSQQARLSEAKRDLSEGRLPPLDKAHLSRLTTRQLEQVAGRVASEVAEQQAAQRARDAEIFQAVPSVRVSKLDMELAARPIITDLEIANAPAKRRKTLRQQQRRREAARDKIERQKKYTAFNMQEYTVREVREMEQRGESPFEVLGGAMVHDTEREHLLRTRKNILDNRSWVRQAVRHGSRDVVERNIMTYASIAGMKQARGGALLTRRRDGNDDTGYDRDRVEQRLEAFDIDLAARFHRLSDGGAAWLFRNTTFATLVDEATHYDAMQKRWVTNSAAMPEVRAQLADWITQAEKR